MGSSPPLKVFRNKEYVASFKHYEDAACFVGCMGGEVRYGHSQVIWVEGNEEQSAAESYDYAAHIMRARVENT